MLTYAAIKFTCEPRKIYVVKASDLRYGKKFFIGKVMCNARWKCKDGCCGSNKHLDDDDFRLAEILLMGNSHKNITTIVEQYYPALTVIPWSKVVSEKMKNEEEVN